jgi:hypothetical protein
VSAALERDDDSNRANLAPVHPSREHRRGSFRNAKDRKGVVTIVSPPQRGRSRETPKRDCSMAGSLEQRNAASEC